MALADRLAQLQGVDRIYLAPVAPYALNTPEIAAEYSKLSLSHPVVSELGIDDFVSTYYNLYKSQPGQNSDQVINNVIDSLKSYNPSLKFGITVYEDQLGSPYIGDSKLSPSVRAKIDVVHLYLHFRYNAYGYSGYVAQAKQIFPNARIVAGSYAYDRIDYIVCSEGGTVHCSKEEELYLYRVSLQIQLHLLRSGAIEGLEFEPGSFGKEDSLFISSNPAICQPARQAECTSNTKNLRQVLLDELSNMGRRAPPGRPRKRIDQDPIKER
jgi:hypothetical protein